MTFGNVPAKSAEKVLGQDQEAVKFQSKSFAKPAYSSK
jgi:hypothetical protein